MSITPIDIQQQQFRTRPLGYEKAGVDHYLELIAEELERLHLQNQQTKEEMVRTRASLEEMRQREETLKETLLTTQAMTDQMKANARKDAENIISEARLRAERIVRDAEDRRIQLISEIQEVKRQKISFETSLRALLESHVRMLDLEVVTLPRGNRNANLLGKNDPLREGDAGISEDSIPDPEET